MRTERIADIEVPDTQLVRDATELIRDSTDELIYHHSRRVFLFGSLQAKSYGIHPDPELLYVAALFHDTGLVASHRSRTQRFEIDGADEASGFLLSHGVPADAAETVWTAIALHTTPEIPYRMSPVIAATTAGVETDVLGLHLANIPRSAIDEIVAAHPRPDFKNRILAAFDHGFADRPASTFGTVNADVLAHFDPTFRRIDFVDVIQNSDWPE